MLFYTVVLLVVALFGATVFDTAPLEVAPSKAQLLIEAVKASMASVLGKRLRHTSDTLRNGVFPENGRSTNVSLS